MRFCRLLPPPEDDAPDPAAPIDEPDDAAAAPMNGEDICPRGAMVDNELPDKAGEATGLMPVAGLAIPTSESLFASVVCSSGTGLFDERA